MKMDAALPTLDELREYLTYKGWNESPPGIAGSLWIKNGASVGIPLRADKQLITGILERLSSWMDLPPRDLSERVRYFRVDVTNFRAESVDESDDTISLEAADALTSSVKAMIRSAATTAGRPQGDLKGSYSTFSDELISKARMGHTKQGSFIFPVLTPLPQPSEPEPDGQALDILDRTAAPEPYERRAMRTLAQSLQAVRDVIITPGVEPKLRDLHVAVELGVSREFCNAISLVLARPEIAEWETMFNWGQAVKAPSTIPSSVRLTSQANDLVVIASDKLRQIRTERSRTFSGSIVSLRHLQGDPEGTVGISTVRNGRLSEVLVTLSYARYRAALRWHDDAKIVLVEGDVTKEKGRLVVKKPTKCHPLDDLYLK